MENENKKTSRNQKGFTFIELIVVIAIMALIFSLTSANFRDFQTRRSLDNAVGQIKSDLRLAQEYARAGKKPVSCDVLYGYSLVATSGSSDYHISAECIDGGSYTICSNPSADTPTGYCTARTLPAEITFDSNNRIRFNTLGRGTELGSDPVILIEHSNGDSRTITVESGGNIE